MSQTFSEQDRYDLKEIFRIYDFSKVEKVNEAVEDAEKKGTTPAQLFDSLYALYKIHKLPQRDAVAKRLHMAVSNASDADVESVLRQTEMKGFSERDAVRSLERKYNVRHVTNRTLQAARNNLNSVQDDSAMEQSELLRTTSSLRHVTVNESSASGLLGNNSGHPEEHRRGSNAAAGDDSEDDEPSVVFARPPSQLSAAPTRENLDEIMAEEVREWLAKMLGESYNADVLALPNFIDALRNGVLLHVLLQKMQDPPVPDADLKLPKRVTGFFIRDNVATFLKEARTRFNLVDAQLFTDSDLVDGKSDRQVVTCLMAMARIAYSAGTIKFAPNIIMYEHEIEQQGTKLTKTDLDRIVREAEAKETQAIPALQRDNTAAITVTTVSSDGAGDAAHFPDAPSEVRGSTESAPADAHKRPAPPDSDEKKARRAQSAEYLREAAQSSDTVAQEAAAATDAADEEETKMSSKPSSDEAQETTPATTVLPDATLDISPPETVERTLSPNKSKTSRDHSLTPERTPTKPPTPIATTPVPSPPPKSAQGKTGAEMRQTPTVEPAQQHQQEEVEEKAEKEGEDEEAKPADADGSKPPSEDLHTPEERGISPADAVNSAAKQSDDAKAEKKNSNDDDDDDEEEEGGGGRVFYLRDGMLRANRPTPEEEQELQEQRKKMPTRVVWKSPSSPLAAAKPPRYHSRHWDGIDIALGRHLNEHYATHPQSPWRFHMVASTSGEYVLYNRLNAQKRVVYLRIIQTRLFLRNAGKNQPWVRIDEALDLLEKLQ